MSAYRQSCRDMLWTLKSVRPTLNSNRPPQTCSGKTHSGIGRHFTADHHIDSANQMIDLE